MVYKVNMKEAAQKLGKHHNTVQRWIKNGQINCVKIGRDWEISQEEIDRIKREGLKLNK